MRLLLASQSPRRAELLRAAGFEFDIQPSDADETLNPGESPEDYVQRVARAKADAVLPGAGERIVLAADTTVVVDHHILAKPADAADAARMLRLLSGRQHQVMTGVTVAGCGRILTKLAVTTVEFAPLGDEEIAAYVGTGEPMDKAGAYAVQGIASRFVTRIEGSYANVVGLPVALIYRLLKELASTG